ncbi:protein transport protein Sec24B [Caerostris darwini]|uniref:Protein transport protein Sec24B n=1 Tax=Caerostris darwini TaxID=1538125 RepID=A0AAV4S1N6_9ARAC|nr:protein transport protein Sec24B [Caerostris darwini]
MLGIQEEGFDSSGKIRNLDGKNDKEFLKINKKEKMSQNPNLSQPFPYQNVFSPNTNQPPSSLNPMSGSPFPPPQFSPANIGTSPAPMPQPCPPFDGSPYNAQNYNTRPSLPAEHSIKPPPLQNLSGMNPSLKNLSSPFPVEKQNSFPHQNGPFPPSPFNNVNSTEQTINGSISSQVNGVGGANRSVQNVPPSSPWASQPRMPLISGGQPNQKLSGEGVGPPPMNQFPSVPPQSLAVDGKTVPKLSQVPSSSGLPMPYGNQAIHSTSPQVTPGTSRPTNSSLNLPSLGASPNPGLIPPNRRNSGDARQYTSPHPPGLYTPNMSYPPNTTPGNSQSGPPSVGPQSTAVRPRYPQQVGYSNQSASPYASPLVNQPNSIQPPPSAFSNSPQPPPAPSMYNSSPMPPPNLTQSPYLQSQLQSPAPQFQGGLPEGPVGGVAGYDPQLHAKMAGLSVHSSFSRLWVGFLPEEFLYDPSSRSYGDPARRPEIKNATIEFIAPSDYMLRPPQPAVYLFLLDVSHAAVETGYLETFCKVMLENLDDLPGDSRMRIGFITFDGSIHFYNLGEGLNQPHMLVVSDIEDVFLPSPDNLLVNIHESKSLITDLLTDLPKRFTMNGDINSCLGAALQVAYKLMSPVGGRVTVVQTSLPNYGPGALKNREDPNQRAGKDISNIGPANDFYKKLALDCSGQQIAVDLFLLCSQYVDIATISCISKYSSGGVQYYPGYHKQLGRLQVNKFAGDLKRYLTRRIGFEAVMRVRCTRGLSIHTFHGNFFVRSTDLLSLPNINPDTGYGMQIAIEENLTEYNSVCFQAAVLYTSSNGERRIRVHTLCLPVVSILQDVLGGADQETVIGLVSKMAVDRSISSSLTDARDALINVCIDVLGVYRTTMTGQVAGALMSPYSTRLIPLFIIALLKHVAFRTGVSTKLDERVFAMERMKALPLQYLINYIYPTLYPVHALDEKNAIHQDDDVIIPQPVILQLSSEKIDRHGAYILDTFDVLYLYIGRAISDQFCTSVLNVPNFSAIPENLESLPELATPESERMRVFVTWLQEQRPYCSPLKIIREDSRDRHIFLQYMLDDRTESLFSYYEFLQHIRQQISK